MATKIESMTLEVKGLFGLYNYTLTTTSTGQPLIITGPNGYGKTTLLTILKNLKLGNILYFLNLPFSEISISINGKNMLVVTSRLSEIKNEDEEEEASRLIEFKAGLTTRDKLLLSVDVLATVMSVGLRDDLMAIRENPKEFSDYDIATILEAHSEEVLKSLIRRQRSNINLVFAALPDVSYVQANRLNQSMPDFETVKESRKKNSQQEEIVRISNHLISLLESEYRQFLFRSQKSDKDFIKNILTQSDTISKDDYERRAIDIEKAFQELNGYGLADKTEMPQYNEPKSFVLKGYLDDLEKNLNCYRTLIDKLDLFTKLIDSKRLAGKKMRIDREHGLRMVSVVDNSFIEIERLSSGEKNQLILIYDLIFRVPDDSVLLIDEPELSLHVAWQMDFLDDLVKIASKKRLQVIVATHSPHIIAERWNLCYDLFEVSNQNPNE